MIITQNVDVVILPNNMYKYREKGYSCNNKDIISVKVEDLTAGSHVKVLIKCDCCGKIVERPYKAVLSQRKSVNMDVCYECKSKKSKITNNERYGFDNPAQSPVIIEKTKNTNLKRYGQTHSFTESVYQKVKNTMMDRYGVPNAMLVPEFNNKIKLSWKEMPKEKKDKIIEKRQKSFLNNSTQKCSSQQKSLYNSLKHLGYDVKLNEPYKNFSIDIALYKDGSKIDIEYDGWYWHTDQQSDIKRDKVLQGYGWKTLRIRSGHLLPDINVLEEEINTLLKSDKVFSDIILEDWRGCA